MVGSGTQPAIVTGEEWRRSILGALSQLHLELGEKRLDYAAHAKNTEAREFGDLRDRIGALVDKFDKPVPEDSALKEENEKLKAALVKAEVEIKNKVTALSDLMKEIEDLKKKGKKKPGPSARGGNKAPSQISGDDL